MARNRTVPPILNYGGGGEDKLGILSRFYVVGSSRKGMSAAALGRMLFIRLLRLNNGVWVRIWVHL